MIGGTRRGRVRGVAGQVHGEEEVNGSEVAAARDRESNPVRFAEPQQHPTPGRTLLAVITPDIELRAGPRRSMPRDRDAATDSIVRFPGIGLQVGGLSGMLVEG